jgi:hypothetical protein
MATYSLIDSIADVANTNQVQSLRELANVLAFQDYTLSKLSVGFIVYVNRLETPSPKLKAESQRLITLAKLIAGQK